ncbi:MAG TPA: hypothetical protein VF286_04210 [Acidiphilium sp.]
MARFAAVAMAIASLTIASLAARPHRAAASDDETLLLAVVVNAYPSGKLGQFDLHGHALRARPRELKALGFRIPASVHPGRDGRIALADIPGMSVRLNQATQTLYVTAPDTLLRPALLRANPGSGSAVPVESGLGATVDYDITGTFTGDETVGAGQFDMRAFSPWGVLDSGLLAYAGDGPQGAGSLSTVRLDTTYMFSPGVWWIGLSLNRSGSFVHILQMNS